MNPAATSMFSDDEIWAASDGEYDVVGERAKETDEDEFYGVRPDSVENNEIAALRRLHAKKGYLDGLASSKEERLQEGFDVGYPEGAQIALKVGRIVGALQVLKSLPDATSLVTLRANEDYVMALKALQIQKILNKKYFNENDLALVDGLHPVIEEWEHKVDQLLKEYGSSKSPS